MDGRARAVQVFHERLQPAGVLEHVGLVLSLVDELDPDARIQEGQLAKALGQHVVVELDVGEDLRAGLETDRGTARLGLAHGRHGRLLGRPCGIPGDAACRRGRYQLQVVG